jgi:group I intron endonuclease
MGFSIEKPMFIYLIVNHITGKYYVGQHKGNNLRKYLQQKFSQAWYELKRKCGGSSYLFRSMRKHGRGAFTIHALLSDIQTREELDQKERDFIEFLCSRDPQYGYNICKGGEGFTGPHSEATRQKIAIASKVMWERPGIRENFNAKMSGRTAHPNLIKSLRDRRGSKASPETIEKLRKSHIGLVRSEESRRKQGASNRGVGNPFYGKRHSEATLAKKWKPVRCADDGEIFPSAGHVVGRFGGSKPNLGRSIRKGHLFMGKRFEYVW